MYENIKILLVEDEAPLLGAMSVKLKKAGFTVLQAHNGREGLDIAMKEFPNIIITDIVMPEMDGLQMIQNVRKDTQWGVSVPIILLTNLNDFNHVATAMEYGVHDYLVKSNWKLKDLLETVKNKLNLTQESDQLQSTNNTTGSDSSQTQNTVSDMQQQSTQPPVADITNTTVPVNSTPVQNNDQTNSSQPISNQTNIPVPNPAGSVATDINTQQPTQTTDDQNNEPKNPNPYFS